MHKTERGDESEMHTLLRIIWRKDKEKTNGKTLGLSEEF